MTCCSKWLRLALWSVVAAVAAVASSTTAGAAEKGTLTIKDGGNVFTADGVRKAEEAFESVTFQAPTKLAVVTFGKVPEAKRSAFEEAKSPDAKKRFFREWAEEVARSSGKPDVLVFVSMEGSHIRALDDRQTDLKRHFDDKDLHTLEQKFVAGFKPGDAATKMARHDASLLEGVNYVAEQLKDTTLPANRNGRAVGAAANNAGDTKGTSIMTYVCIGIVALLGVWLVIGVVRMMMGGGGGGGGGYGGGGMGGGGGMMGGGGGGLMTGLLGGMLGAVAGNYLYNNFMGGNSHSTDPGASGGGYGDSGTTGDTGAGDYSGGGDGGGSDFGGDTTSGDTGGGDFGGGDSGGGDFGGGSDFGGGDSGGGDSGGGDW